MSCTKIISERRDHKVESKLMKVEVKSSIPTNSESHQAIILKSDIKGAASHNKVSTWKEPGEPDSELQ